MDTTKLAEGGFVFDNVARNAMLERTGLKVPKGVSTGTTICGIVFKDGVILGADTRATEVRRKKNESETVVWWWCALYRGYGLDIY